MDFRPNDAQEILTSSVERLLQDTHDLQTRLRVRDPRADDRVWGALAELGVMGLEIEEADGGSGGTFEDMAAVLKPLGEALVTVPFVATAVVSAGLLRRASPAQKTSWLPSLAAGGLKVCVAHSERRARDTLSWVETTARLDGESWKLRGTKSVVIGGDSADLLLITARTKGAPADAGGLSVFAVPRESAGLVIRSYPLYDRSGAADLTFDDLSLPMDALVGARDAAYADLALAWDRGAAAVCVEAVGVMDRLRDLTLDHLRTREQFGRPIGQFQALQHRMADAYMAIELARSMSLLAVAAISAVNPDSRALNVSAAKVVVSDACREVGQTCVQLHGGIALTEEYPAGHYFKRLVMIERIFGDADHHLERYANTM